MERVRIDLTGTHFMKNSEKDDSMVGQGKEKSVSEPSR